MMNDHSRNGSKKLKIYRQKAIKSYLFRKKKKVLFLTKKKKVKNYDKWNSFYC